MGCACVTLSVTVTPTLSADYQNKLAIVRNVKTPTLVDFDHSRTLAKIIALCFDQSCDSQEDLVAIAFTDHQIATEPNNQKIANCSQS